MNLSVARASFGLVLLLAGLSLPVRADDAPMTGYTPSSAVNERVKAKFVAEIARKSPEAAAKIETAFKQADLRLMWASAVAADGLHANDVADAIASWWVLNWLIAHRQTENTPAQAVGTRRQVASALARTQSFRTLSNDQRQEMAETIIYKFMLHSIAYKGATGRHDEARLGQLASEAQQRFKAENHADLLQMTLTETGLHSTAPRVETRGRYVPPPEKPLPVTAPGQGLAIAEIDHVGVTHWFGITPTGLSNSYNTYVFLKDGTAYHDPLVALSDLDVAKSKTDEPLKWGRWSEAGGLVTLVFPNNAPQTKKADEFATCRPGRDGQTLDAVYSHVGGSGPLIPGGIATLSEAELRLHADGSFGRDSSTAVGGGTGIGGVTIGGGSTSPTSSGRYRLDGYGLELASPGKTPLRRFFCLYTDDNEMIFFGTSEWFVRGK